MFRLFAFLAALSLSAAFALAAEPPKSDAAAARIEKLFTSMRDGTFQQPFDTKWFPDLHRADIPALLKVAESTRPTKSFPVSLESSMAQTTPPSEGVVALWFIEGIRAGGKLPSLNPLLLSFNEKDKAEDTQRAAAAAYKAWWNKAEKLPQAESGKLEPLAGTQLHWY